LRAVQAQGNPGGRRRHLLRQVDTIFVAVRQLLLADPGRLQGHIPELRFGQFQFPWKGEIVDDNMRKWLGVHRFSTLIVSVRRNGTPGNGSPSGPTLCQELSERKNTVATLGRNGVW